MKTPRIALVLPLLCGAAIGGEKPALRIYLPRDVSVSADNLRLGSVSILRSADEKLLKKAEAVALGRSPWTKERIVIDRRTILSRLACCGIRTADLQITGAPAVTVTGKHKVLSAEAIVRCAESYLARHPPAPAGCRWQLLARPREMILPGPEAPELKAELASGAPPHHVKVKITVQAGGKAMGTRAALFQLRYPTRRAVATKGISPGQAVTPANAKIETVMAPRPAKADWAPPFGKIAAARLAPGAVIRPTQVAAPKLALVVRRNQTVVMRIEGPGFTITALGLALQNGRPGESIKVRNIDSNRVLTAVVAADGTVRPTFEESRS